MKQTKQYWVISKSGFGLSFLMARVFALILLCSFFNVKAMDGQTDVINLNKTVEAVAKEFRLSPILIMSVINVESNGEPCAISRAGAQGLMQIMPETASYLGVKDTFDPVESIYFGTKYLSELLLHYNGNLPRALAHYNGGTKYGKGNNATLIGEPKDYIEKVFSQMKRLNKVNLNSEKLITRASTQLCFQNNSLTQ